MLDGTWRMLTAETVAVEGTGAVNRSSSAGGRLVTQGETVLTDPGWRLTTGSAVMDWSWWLLRTGNVVLKRLSTVLKEPV